MNILTVKLIVCIIIGIIIFIPIIIAIQYNKTRLPIQICENSYIMYHSKKLFRSMVMCAIGDYAFVVFGIAIYEDSNSLFVVILFLIAAVVSSCLAMYALLWRAVVDKESMTIYVPCFPVRYFKFYEISKVKQIKDGMVKDRLTAYVNGRKVFEIDEDVVGFYTLYEQLYRVGKLETSQIKESFIVKNTMEEIVRDGVIAIFLFGLFIAALVGMGEDLGPEYSIGMGIIAALSIWGFVDTVLWRIIVTYDTLYIRTGVCNEKVYTIKEINAVYQEKDGVTLFSGKKKVIKVSVAYENYSLFMERMRNLGVEFYKYGTLHHFK